MPMQTNMRLANRIVFRIMLTLVILTPIVSARDYVENFDTDTVGIEPSDTWYLYSTSGSGNYRVSSSESLSTLNSFLFQTNSGTGNTNFDFTEDPRTQVDWCGAPAAYLDYSFLLTSVSANAITVHLRGGDGGDPWEGNIIVDGDGTVDVNTATTSGTQTTGIPDLTLVSNTWYQVIARPDCDDNKLDVFFPAQGKGTIADAAGGGSGTCSSAICGLDIRGNGPMQPVYFDNIILRNAPEPPPTAVGSAATASVVGLNGMSVDPSGTTLIAQVDTGNSVVTFSADSLGSPVGSDTVDCGTTQDRVDAIREYVAYVDCVGGDVKTLKIRAPANLASESLPDYCEPGGDNCASTIAIDEDEAGCIESGNQALSIENVLKDIKSTDFAPIDYSRVTEPESFTDTGSRAFAMAYSTNSGAVGVFGYTSRDDACDQVRLSNKPLPTISSVDDICTWQVQSGSALTTYIGVADNTLPPRVAIVGFSIDPEGFALTPNVGPFTTFGAFSGAESIGCSGNKLLFGLDNRAVLYDFGTGTVLWDITHGGDGLNGVHLSGSGNWALVRTSSTHVTVISADYTSLTTSPDRVASLEIPTGTYFSNFIGFNGANAWIGTTGTPGVIARYPISPQTNATCDQASCVPVAPTGGPGTGDVFTFGIFATNPFGEGEGPDAAWGMFLVVIASFFGAILFGAIRKKRKVNLHPGLGAAIFGGLTFAICAVSGLFSGRVLFFFLLVAAAIVALYLWRRR